MSIAEARTLDMSTMLMRAYELADMINGSTGVAEYLYWKERMAVDTEAQRLIRAFQKKKELFEECERFGHFHPDYHKALDEVRAIQAEMDGCETLSRYREAEERLDELLHAVSKTIAQSVSESIKVPGGRLEDEGGGCSSGSCSTGGCGGNCG